MFYFINRFHLSSISSVLCFDTPAEQRFNLVKFIKQAHMYPAYRNGGRHSYFDEAKTRMRSTWYTASERL